MGELLPAVPTTPNNVTDSWQPLVDSNVMSSYGMNVVTLTEWSTSTVIPAIAQGSAIDIDGSTARFVTGEPITDAPGNGTVYVMFTVSGTSVSASLTLTAPTWDNTKGGWYGATGNRYSGHLMTKNGTSYTNKGRYRDESDGEQLIIEANRGIDTNTIDAGTVNATALDVNGNGDVSGTLSVGILDVNNSSTWTGTYGTWTIPATTAFVVPAGGYMVAQTGGGAILFEIYDGSAWVGDDWGKAMALFSDGVNYRFFGGSGAVIVAYRKFW